MSPRSLAAFVTVVLLLAGVAPAAGLGGASAGSDVQAGGVATGVNALAPHNSSLGPGEVEMRIGVAADGDARWRVMTVVSVTNGDERAAFDELVREFNESESPLGLDTFRAGAANASRVTGRSMEVRNVERHHALHNETGALWITFTWTNFGNTSGDRLSIDDGFDTSSGVWLPSLSDGETLVVVPPEGYGVSSAPTGTSSAPSSLSNGVARWEGPQEFGQRGPWIVYSGDAPVTTATAGPTATTEPPTNGGPTTGTGGDGNGGVAGALPLVVLVVLAGASAAVLAAYMRGDDGEGLAAILGGGAGGNGAGGEDPPDRTSETDSAADASATDGSGGAVGDGSAAASAGAVAGAADEPDDGGIDEALLSDEERVERLIERNGGRMKQAAIVKETGWSNAKVSQLLSSMEEEGRIDKLRIGRENLISFPDEDVTDLDSE